MAPENLSVFKTLLWESVNTSIEAWLIPTI